MSINVANVKLLPVPSTGSVASYEKIEGWLDDMAQFNGTHIWDTERGCWVWEDTGSPVDQPTD